MSYLVVQNDLTRYRVPSSAVSLPSLSMEDDPAVCGSSATARSITRPLIEKSASSASIVRHKDSRVNRLGKCSKYIRLAPDIYLAGYPADDFCG